MTVDPWPEKAADLAWLTSEKITIGHNLEPSSHATTHNARIDRLLLQLGAKHLINQHVDYANDMVSLGIDRDTWKQRAEAAEEAIARSGEGETKPLHELDARKICDALGFDPTNHHNAAKCPYCNPNGLVLTAPASPIGGDGARELINRLRAVIGPLFDHAGIRIVDPADLIEALASPVPMPEGFVLVPVEPTEAMLVAYDLALWDAQNEVSYEPANEIKPEKCAYRAMIASAPPPSIKASSGEGK